MYVAIIINYMKWWNNFIKKVSCICEENKQRNNNHINITCTVYNTKCFIAVVYRASKDFSVNITFARIYLFIYLFLEKLWQILLPATWFKEVCKLCPI